MKKQISRVSPNIGKTKISSQAMTDLMRVQDLFGQLGFCISLDQRTYYKDFGLLDGGNVRLVPKFDVGIINPASYKLVGITVEHQQFIPIADGLPSALSQVPRECREDVATILATLAPFMHKQVDEKFIITASCGVCNKVVSSFFHDKNAYKCLDCM